MYKNYLTTAFRNILRNKLFSAINVGGLSLSLLAAIMILLFVNDEVSFDQQWADSDRIYRMENGVNSRSRGLVHFATSYGILKYGLERDFQEIEDIGRLFTLLETIVREGELFDEALGYVDPEFLNIYNFEFIQGDPASALADNQSIILTRSSAQKYFGDENALGKILTINSGLFGIYDFKVSGVIEDVPLNSHLAFESLARLDPSRAPTFRGLDQAWTASAVYTYIKFKEGTDLAAFVAALPSHIDRVGVLTETASAFYDKPSDRYQPSIRPIEDIHLYSNKIAELKTPGNITTVYVFLVVAFLLIFIAAVNFVNLTTARASLRAREIGLRKVMGADRKQLRVQFLFESVFIVFLALFIAIGAAQTLLPWYNEFLAKELTLGNLFSPLGFLVLLLSGAGLGILSGLYPAFFLASFKPAVTLKSNKSSETSGTVLLRKILVVGQFSIAVSLIIIFSVIYFQMEHLQNRDLKYNTENVWVLNLPATQTLTELENFKARIELIDGVENAGGVAFAPGTVNSISATLLMKPGESEEFGMDITSVGPGFFESLEIELLAGRFLSKEHALDLQPAQNDPEDTKSYSIVINETAANLAGFSRPEDAVGSFLKPLEGARFTANLFQIVGVIPDIQMVNAYSENHPAFYYYQPNPNTRGFVGAMLVKIEPGKKQAIEEAMKEAWTQLFPDNIFVMNDLSELMEAVYINERNQSTAFRYFMVLSFALSALGLYGLAAFTADRRTKEIGLRKIMGASIPDILHLLLWQFSKPVMIANLIAWPLAWYFAQDWLTNFSDRIDISIFLFLGAALIAILIAWVTVAGHAYKVARANPIKALRYE